MITMLLSPFNGPGGNQYIQIRVIEYLSQYGNKCKLFGTKQCFVYAEIIKRELEFDFIEIDSHSNKMDYSRYLTKTDYSQYLTSEDIILTTNGDFFDCILLFSKSDARIIFLDIIYPWLNGFIIGKRSIPIKLFAKNQEIKILSLLNSSNALFFIDVMGKSIVEKRLNLKISNQQYLPIPINVPPRVTSTPLNHVVNITYIGRCVSWKVQPVLKILKDIMFYNLSDRVVLNIVTDDVNDFRDFILEKNDFKGIEIAFHQNLGEREINQLFKGINLNIGMGTAALDGAKNGIPTIVIDASDYDFPDDYRYRWIFESKDLVLGKMMEKGVTKFDGMMTFEDMLTNLEREYSELGQKCYDYVRENYDIENFVNKIETYSVNASLPISSLRALLVIRYFKFLRMFGIV